MASKPLYLRMDVETLNQLPALEQFKGVIRALQTFMMILLPKVVSNVNLKTSTILAKRLIVGTWLCPGHGPAD